MSISHMTLPNAVDKRSKAEHITDVHLFTASDVLCEHVDLRRTALAGHLIVIL